MSHSGWLSDSVIPERLDLLSDLLANEINADKDKLGINSIAVTGISGLVIGGLVSVKTNLPLIMVRKDESKHSVYNVEFDDSLEELNYCILDDLIASGATIKRIINKIEFEQCKYFQKKKEANPIKIYLYREEDETDTFTMEITENKTVKIPIFHFNSRHDLIGK